MKRFYELAARFGLPVVVLVDTPGAFAGRGAEERGQAWAISADLMALARIPVPVISAIIGEGCSGGALAMCATDYVGMLENSYLSVIAPEACASIIFRDPGRAAEAAEALKLTAADMKGRGIVDEIIPEPLGGAHNDPASTIEAVGKSSEPRARWPLRHRPGDPPRGPLRTLPPHRRPRLGERPGRVGAFKPALVTFCHEGFLYPGEILNSCGLIGTFLGQIMACVEGPAPYVVRVLAPDRPHVVDPLHHAAPAPERQKRTLHLATLVQIRFVVDEVDGGCSPVVFAARVDRGGVKAAFVLGQGLGRERLEARAPAAELLPEVVSGVGPDQGLRQS